MDLSDVEVRVLGSLMEKQVTTPDQYPLTVNSLRLACNQSTNRYPITELSETDINAALVSLRDRKLTRIVYSTSNRAPKHRHTADESLRLEPAEQAVLTVLALRGPQTVGELKTRTERLHPFGDLGEIEQTLAVLAERAEPLTSRLTRRPGQKEERYAHLLAGPIDESSLIDEPVGAPRMDRTGELQTRVDSLEARLVAMEAVVDQLSVLLDEPATS